MICDLLMSELTVYCPLTTDHCLANRVDIALLHDEEGFAIQLDFCAGIFSVEDGVVHLDSHGLVFFARSHGDNGSLLRFLLGGVRGQ